MRLDNSRQETLWNFAKPFDERERERERARVSPVPVSGVFAKDALKNTVCYSC
jgi:hypothetical protein